MNILVTGGMGFIGSHFIRLLLRRHPDVSVVNLDKLTYAGSPENLEQDVTASSRYFFVQGDVTDSHIVHEVMTSGIGGGVDTVVHLAAETHVDRSIASPLVFAQTNLIGTTVLLEEALRQKVRCFLYVSTDEVYGDATGASHPSNELAPIRPSSPYAASKAAADLLVLSYARTYGLPVIVTRCTNNYGPNQFPEKLIPLTISRAWKDQFIPVYGDGLQQRDWLFVTDHCRALERALFLSNPGEVYNVASGLRYSNLEIIRHVLKIMGKSETMIQHVDDRAGHDRCYAVDAAKIKCVLGWVPMTDLDHGLEKTVAWYLAHPVWVEWCLERLHGTDNRKEE